MSKKQKSNTVIKELDPQSMTILDNIEALTAELRAANAGSSSPEKPEDEVEMQDEGVKPEDERDLDTDSEETDAETEDEEKEVKLTIKKEADTNTPSEGATATDDAEERIEDVQTEESKTQADAVAKMVQALQTAFGPVQKQQPVNPVIKSLDNLASTLKQIAENTNANAKAIKGISDATGITQEIERVEKQIAEKKKQEMPKTTAPAIAELAQVFKAALTSDNQNSTQNNNNNSWGSNPSSLANKNLSNPDFLSILVDKDTHDSFKKSNQIK